MCPAELALPRSGLCAKAAITSVTARDATQLDTFPHCTATIEVAGTCMSAVLFGPHSLGLLRVINGVLLVLWVTETWRLIAHLRSPGPSGTA